MKLNRFQQFFHDAYLKFTKFIFDKGEEDIKPLLNQQSKDMKNILSEVSNLMLTYKIDNNIMSMSESDQKKEKKRLDKVIANSFKTQYANEQKQITSILNEVGQNKYNSNSYLFTLDSKNKRKRLNTEELKKIIGQKVEGANYSERLWADKNQVASTLQKEIKKFMQGKTSVNDIQEIIEKKFSANEFNTRRIVTSEIARVQSSVSDKWCKDNGIEFQLFSVVLDGVTSKTCRSHANDKPYRVDDPGKPIPPLHPFCRSTLIPITPEGYRPNMPKDDTSWNEYKVWEEKNSLDSNNKSDIIKEKNGIRKVSNFNELEKYARNNLGIEIVTDEVKQLDFESVRDTCESMEKVFNDFPQLKGFVAQLYTSKSGIMSCSPIDTTFLNTQISFNPSYYSDKEKIKRIYARDADSGFHPKGTTYEISGVHELGHAIEAYLIKKQGIESRSQRIQYWNDCTIAKEIVSDACKAAKKSPLGKGKKNVELKNDVSGYALNDASECMAEAVADYFGNGENASILSKEIMKIIKEMMKL